MRRNRTAIQKHFFDAHELKATILRDAQALGLPLETTKVMADKVTEEMQIWVKKRTAITEDDLNRHLAQELKKYNEDLAYVYQNRGKIV